MSKKRESYSLLKSLIALILIACCLWAAQWQYHRGTARHDRNQLITTQSSLGIVKLSTASLDPESFQWRLVELEGRFNPDRQILLRNHYFEGKYGFELLTAFTATSGEEFWVDRGWVQAGATATEQPEIPAITSAEVSIVGRLRLDSSLPQGNFFALPSTGNGLISQANAQSSNTEVGINSPFYFDLISGNLPTLTPEIPAELPELSDGPHFAYSLQWVIFAGLVIYGRLLIRREILPRKEIGIES